MSDGKSKIEVISVSPMHILPTIDLLNDLSSQKQQCAIICDVTFEVGRITHIVANDFLQLEHSRTIISAFSIFPASLIRFAFELYFFCVP